MKVLGIGNALVDVLAHIEDDKLLDSLGLPKGSMQLIDDTKFEHISSIMKNMNPSIVSGGSASNTIRGLATMGVDTGFIGRISSDYYGLRYKEDLVKYNIKSHLLEVQNEYSGVASTFISVDGERTFATYLGAAALLDEQELNQSDFDGYDYCYIEGYLLQNYRLVETALQMCRIADLKVVLDMASYNIVEEHHDFLLNIVPKYVDIVFANEHEGKAMFGKEPQEAVALFADMVDLAVVKNGSKGSWIQQGKNQFFVPAEEVKCLDATGAGDLYAAGFIYGLINNKSIEVCGKMGTVLASKVIQVVGPQIKDSDWEVLKMQVKELS